MIGRVSVVHAVSYTDIGGAPFVAIQLARYGRGAGIDATVVGQMRGTGIAAGNDQRVVLAQTRDRSGFAYSSQYRQLLQWAIADASIVHSHSVWMYANMAAAKYSARAGKPHVIAPHGALEPWALRRSSLRKAAMRLAFQNRALRNAACLHALSASEASDLRSLGLTNPIAVIPNGVEIPVPLDDANLFESAFPDVVGKQVVLFLGRIHPKKGIEQLIRAWGSLGTAHQDWLLVVAGPDELQLESRLNATLREVAPTAKVLFTGNLTGSMKRAAYARASIFILPSFSEGFSIAVLEAMAAGLPAVITKECNFPAALQSGAAVQCRPDPASIHDALDLLIKQPESARRATGAKAKGLVSSEYTWDAVAAKTAELYKWILDGARKPEFVEVL